MIKTPKVKIPTLSRKAREGWGTRSQQFHVAVPTGVGESCPPVQKVGGMGLRGWARASTIKMFSFGPRSRVGLPRQPIRGGALRIRKTKSIEFRKFFIRESSSCSRVGVRSIVCPVSVSSRHPQLRRSDSLYSAELCANAVGVRGWRAIRNSVKFCNTLCDSLRGL